MTFNETFWFQAVVNHVSSPFQHDLDYDAADWGLKPNPSINHTAKVVACLEGDPSPTLTTAVRPSMPANWYQSLLIIEKKKKKKMAFSRSGRIADAKSIWGIYFPHDKQPLAILHENLFATYGVFGLF